MTSGWANMLLLCCSTFDHTMLLKTTEVTQKASILFAAGPNAKGRMQSKHFPHEDCSNFFHIYYKFALGTKPNSVVLPSRTSWMFTLKQNITVLSLSTTCPSLAEWLLFHWACQWLYSAQCHQPMVESLGGVSGLDPLWGCTTLPLLQQTLHHATKSCTCVGFCCVSEQELRQ